jgi:tungstate transport system substrate-binding protein
VIRTLSLLLALALFACQPPAPTPSSAPTPSPAPPTKPAASPATTPGVRDASGTELILATTTSTQDSGLLEVLVPQFEKASGLRVKTISIGTGAALQLGARGEVDVLLVHAPDAEREWMEQGNGVERTLVMHNDFVVVGPPADPAGVKGESSIKTALERVAEKQVPWVSRDDNSGTDQLEKKLWKDAGLSPKGQAAWYLISGQGMGATLTLADQKSAYTLTDRATYLARKATLQSTIAVQGDRALLNVYHVMPVNPAKFPNVRINAEGGRAFARFLIAPETQRTIGEFGKERYGEALFVPDAGKAEAQVGA